MQCSDSNTSDVITYHILLKWWLYYYFLELDDQIDKIILTIIKIKEIVFLKSQLKGKFSLNLNGKIN